MVRYPLLLGQINVLTLLLGDFINGMYRRRHIASIEPPNYADTISRLGYSHAYRVYTLPYR
jgi:hypothetical protein